MSSAVVLDASVAVELLLEDPGAAPVPDWLGGSIAPSHFDLEVLSALGRMHRDGTLAADIVAGHLDGLAGLPVERRPITDLLGEAWRLRNNLSLADALYVALAESLGLPLLTADARLAAAYDGAELVRA